MGESMNVIGKNLVKKVDATGLNCPQPLIKTKKALEEMRSNNESGILQVIVSNEAAKINVGKFAASQGCAVEVVADGANYVLNINNDLSAVTSGQGYMEMPLEKLGAKNASNICYLIGKNTMGTGSDELGELLIRSFFYTLLETEPCPQKIFFVNSGVLLTLDDSSVLRHLEELKKKGAEILVCGTCLDFYQAKDRLAVGEVTNMYAIVEEMGNLTAKMVTI